MTVEERGGGGPSVSDAYMEKHQHVPSQLIVDVMENRLDELYGKEASAAVILDGFPRSLEQAKLFLDGEWGEKVRLGGVHLDLK